jgi:hypothetical protein
MSHKLISSLLLTIFAAMPTFAAMPAAKSHQLSQIIAKPIPPGYHFPTPTTMIDKWIATSDTAAMRAHAWDIFSGITADSGERYEGKELPIWETWYGYSDVFPVTQTRVSTTAAASAFLASHRGPLRVFVQPHQFTHTKSGLSMLSALGPEDSRLMSFNKFSPHAATFIISPQVGPNGQIYYYNSGSSLRNLNTAFPTDTNSQDRSINQFPVEALVIKPVFSIVKSNGLTPLPLWQGATASIKPENPTPDTWKTCILIDPKSMSKQIRLATASEIARANPVKGLACKAYLYASLSTLYWFKLSDNEAATFNKARNGGVDPDDFAVLVALHVSTRETPFWTWQTFYWQPGEDTPDKFPGSKVGQPKNLKAPWTNYAMCANYSQTITPGGNIMDVCLNPYLETTPAIPAGMASNCMSCHGVARYSANQIEPYPLDYKAPIPFFTDPFYFNSSTTHTEFSWAIASQAMR